LPAKFLAAWKACFLVILLEIARRRASSSKTNFPTTEPSSEYVGGLAALAQPLLRGLGRGQKLDIRWPQGPDRNPFNGDGFSDLEAIGVLDDSHFAHQSGAPDEPLHGLCRHILGWVI
jgi:hypothetical protein